MIKKILLPTVMLMMGVSMLNATPQRLEKLLERQFDLLQLIEDIPSGTAAYKELEKAVNWLDRLIRKAAG